MYAIFNLNTGEIMETGPCRCWCGEDTNAEKSHHHAADCVNYVPRFNCYGAKERRDGE